jgi:hypothetical protein
MFLNFTRDGWLLFLFYAYYFNFVLILTCSPGSVDYGDIRFSWFLMCSFFPTGFFVIVLISLFFGICVVGLDSCPCAVYRARVGLRFLIFDSSTWKCYLKFKWGCHKLLLATDRTSQSNNASLLTLASLDLFHTQRFGSYMCFRNQG